MHVRNVERLTLEKALETLLKQSANWWEILGCYNDWGMLLAFSAQRPWMLNFMLCMGQTYSIKNCSLPAHGHSILVGKHQFNILALPKKQVEHRTMK